MSTSTSASRRWRVALAGLATGVMVSGTVAVAAPAVATQDESYAATNWKKIWKKNLKKYADKRYYTKTQSDSKYATKAESDAKYAGVGSSYSKAESDGKYRSATGLIRGTFSMSSDNNTVSLLASADISFGVTLSGPPTAHYIVLGDPVPAGCSGTPDAPGADPGHFCIFETLRQNMVAPIIATPLLMAGATPYGALLLGTGNATSGSVALGSWAVRPSGLAAGTNVVDSPQGEKIDLDALLD